VSTIKERWLTALRSDKYQQAVGRLKATKFKDSKAVYDDEPVDSVPSDAPIGYCCLGVLCDVLQPNGWQHTEGPAYDDSGYETGGTYEAAAWVHPLGWSGELLEEDFVSQYGEMVWLPGKQVYVMHQQQGKEVQVPVDPQGHLASLNDGGSDFAAIADFIEQNIDIKEKN